MKHRFVVSLRGLLSQWHRANLWVRNAKPQDGMLCCHPKHIVQKEKPLQLGKPLRVTSVAVPLRLYNLAFCKRPNLPEVVEVRLNFSSEMRSSHRSRCSALLPACHVFFCGISLWHEKTFTLLPERLQSGKTLSSEATKSNVQLMYETLNSRCLRKSCLKGQGFPLAGFGINMLRSAWWFHTLILIFLP